MGTGEPNAGSKPATDYHAIQQGGSINTPSHFILQNPNKLRRDGPLRS